MKTIEDTLIKKRISASLYARNSEKGSRKGELLKDDSNRLNCLRVYGKHRRLERRYVDKCVCMGFFMGLLEARQ